MDHAAPNGPIYIFANAGPGGPSGWVVAIIASLLTATGSAVVGLVLENYRRHHDSRALAATLLAEIAALMKLGRELNLIGIYEDLLSKLRIIDRDKLPLPDFPPDVLTFPVTVYEKSADKLGLLGADLGAEVVWFYNLLAGFRSTARMVTSHGDHPAASRIASLDLVLRSMREGTSRADRLMEALREKAAQKWQPGHL